MTTHAERVEAIAARVRERHRAPGFASLRKTEVSHFVPDARDPKHRDNKIDVRSLNAILHFDVENLRCIAEPGVAFSDLVRTTLAWGALPKLVPELKTITLGGAVAGCSVESMSFRYGGFHDSCRSYEVVTGTGNIVRCSRRDQPLLFDMIHGSYGTLGILTQLEFDLIPAKRYVRVEYRHYQTFESFQAEMLAQCAARAADFIDGIVHGPDHFVLCLGYFVDRAPHVSDYTWLNIYYRSTESLREDYLTTYDYLFRYDTECHWLSRTLPGMETAPMRALLGKTLLGSTQLLRWSHRLGTLADKLLPPRVVVDVFIPSENFGKFYRWYEQRVDFFPLWVVPYRVPKPYPWVADAHAAKAVGDVFIDCAVYGKRNDEPGVNYYRLLEDKTRELGGLKTLISKNFYDRDTFWSIYHRDNYDRVKRETDPQNMFRGLYEKFHYGATVEPGSAGDPTDRRRAPVEPV